MKDNYTNAEIIQVENVLKNFYTSVRVVDPIKQAVCNFSNDGRVSFDYFDKQSYDYNWNKRCNKNSLEAFLEKKSATKFEFIDNDIYYLISQYIKVDDKNYVLELLNKVGDNATVDCSAEHEFVSKICEYNEKLYRDPVTRAYNRLYLNEHILHDMIDSLSSDQDLCLAMIDVDEFKAVNDSCGHRIGDKVLTQIVSIIKSNINSLSGDYVARYGGDEFVLILKETNKNNAKEVLDSILNDVSNLYFKFNKDMTITLSIGCTCLSELEEINEESLIHQADLNLYKAKNKGKNCLVI